VIFPSTRKQSERQDIIPAFFNLKEHLLIAVLLISISIPAFSDVSFSDNKGKTVVSQKDIKIRLIERTDSDIRTAEAVFTVNAPVQKCFGVITKVTEYHEFMPDIKKAVVFNKTEDGIIYDFVYDAPFFDIEYRLKINSSETDSLISVNWSYVDGDLNDNNGSWIFTPDPEKPDVTVIYYSIYLDPGTFLPDWLVTKLTAGSIPDMIESVRKRVKEK